MIIRDSNDTNSSEDLLYLFDMEDGCVYIPNDKWDKKGMKNLLNTIRNMDRDDYNYLYYNLLKE